MSLGLLAAFFLAATSHHNSVTINVVDRGPPETPVKQFSIDIEYPDGTFIVQDEKVSGDSFTTDKIPSDAKTILITIRVDDPAFKPHHKRHSVESTIKFVVRRSIRHTSTADNWRRSMPYAPTRGGE